MQLIKYRFKTRAIGDYRPLKDMENIQMPWWCSGEAVDGSYVIIICILPEDKFLEDYWDDAYDIEYYKVDKITYTDRFPKPSWIK